MRNLSYEADALAAICRKYGIARLSLFGSIVRGDFDPNRSDVDVLIEFESGANKSLFVLVEIEEALTKLFGRQAHICTAGALSRYFRDQVLKEAEVAYVAA